MGSINRSVDSIGLLLSYYRTATVCNSLNELTKTQQMEICICILLKVSICFGISTDLMEADTLNCGYVSTNLIKKMHNEQKTQQGMSWGLKGITSSTDESSETKKQKRENKADGQK